MLARKQFTPVLAPILYNRAQASIICGALALHGLATVYALPGWGCPVLSTTGLPCPGCGLSRAILALVQGDLQTAFTLHVFAPVFLVGMCIIGFASLAPTSYRYALSAHIEAAERHTGITSLLLIGLVLYWAIRLMVMPTMFISLIRG